MLSLKSSSSDRLFPFAETSLGAVFQPKWMPLPDNTSSAGFLTRPIYDTESGKSTLRFSSSFAGAFQECHENALSLKTNFQERDTEFEALGVLKSQSPHAFARFRANHKLGKLAVASDSKGRLSVEGIATSTNENGPKLQLYACGATDHIGNRLGLSLNLGKGVKAFARYAVDAKETLLGAHVSKFDTEFSGQISLQSKNWTLASLNTHVKNQFKLATLVEGTPNQVTSCNIGVAKQNAFINYNVVNHSILAGLKIEELKDKICLSAQFMPKREFLWRLGVALQLGD